MRVSYAWCLDMEGLSVDEVKLMLSVLGATGAVFLGIVFVLVGIWLRRW